MTKSRVDLILKTRPELNKSPTPFCDRLLLTFLGHCPSLKTKEAAMCHHCQDGFVRSCDIILALSLPRDTRSTSESEDKPLYRTSMSKDSGLER